MYRSKQNALYISQIAPSSRSDAKAFSILMSWTEVCVVAEFLRLPHMEVCPRLSTHVVVCCSLRISCSLDDDRIHVSTESFIYP